MHPIPGDPALFYLSSGDVLPGTCGPWTGPGPNSNRVSWQPESCRLNDLDAIQFGQPARLSVQGFNDPGWQIVKGDEKSVRRTNGVLEMDPGTTLGYPSLMQSSEISFKYSSNGFSACRLRLFCAGTDGTHSMNLLLGNTGNQFISGLEEVEGQFENQTQIKTTPGEPVTVRLSIGEKQVELFVNDLPMQQFPIDPSKCAGSGLMIEPAGLWGNGELSRFAFGFLGQFRSRPHLAARSQQRNQDPGVDRAAIPKRRSAPASAARGERGRAARRDRGRHSLPILDFDAASRTSVCRATGSRP
jgi:hypothetical protein